MDAENQPSDPQPGQGRAISGIHALEIVFLAVVGLIVLAAFIEAFSYKLVSSRTPFVVMVPLLILIGVQALRLTSAGALGEVRFYIGEAVRGRNAVVGKLSALSASFVGVVGVIYTLGHYIGIGGFIFLLMRGIAKERLFFSILVTAMTTGAILATFEYAFGVELYRGLLFRYLAGYRVF